MGRLMHVDGLRAVAVLAVLLFHLGFDAFSGGFVGVDVFFVISGYVINRMIIYDLANDSFSFRAFYCGRMRRLMPALVLVVLLTAVGAFLVVTPQHLQDFAGSAIATLLAWSNIYFWQHVGYFDLDAHAKPLLHTWTLSIEWQFYAIWPVLVAFLFSFRSRYLAPLAIATIALASFAANLAWQGQPATIFYWMPFRIFEFAIGALLLWAPAIRNCNIREFAFLLGIALVAYAVLTYDARTLFPSYNALAPAIGAGLAIHAAEGTRFGRIIRNRVAAYVGQISYSTYLVHWPLIVFYSYVVFRPLSAAEALTIGATSLAVGAALYHAVEWPLWKGQQWRAGRTYAVTAAASLTLIMLALDARSTGWAWRSPQSTIKTDQTSLNSIWGRSGCVDPCSYGDAEAAASILVMGDSHVDHYAQTLGDSGGKEFNFLHLHGGSCFFGSNLVRHSDDPATDGCVRANEKKKHWLKNPKVVAIVHGQRWPGYGNILETASGERLRFDDVEQLYAAQLADIEALYADFDGPVVLLNFVPSGRLSCLSIPQYLPIGCPPTDLTLSRAFASMAKAFIAKHHGRFRFVDPADYLCDGERCQLIRRNRLLYVDDSGHISRYAAWRIVPHIMQAVRFGLRKPSTR